MPESFKDIGSKIAIALVPVMFTVMIGFFVWISNMNTRITVIEQTTVGSAEIRKIFKEELEPLIEQLRDHEVRIRDLEQAP